MKRSTAVLSVVLVLALSAAVFGVPVIVPDFATDPSGPQFSIQPVPETDPNSRNLPGPPALTFGEMSVPDGTLNTLRMTWQMHTEDLEAQAGWQLAFGSDPDLRNGRIILSINPPGGWLVNPNPPPANFFGGIMSVSVVAVDTNKVVAGGWGFNTDLAGALVPVNDPLAAGLVSLQNNVMHNVAINIGNGPVPGSALITPVAGPPGFLPGPFTGPNFLIAGNNNFANIGTLQFFENGILRANANVIPNQPIPGLLNYWDHITVTGNPIPEPATLGLLGLGSVGLLLLRRLRRR